MSDIIGRIGSVAVEKYSVLQSDDGDGRGWLDFSTLREPWEVAVAVRMVDNRGGINGFRTADYRIWQNGEAIYTHNPNRFKFGSNIILERGDILQLHRLDDAGWITCRVIHDIEDAKIAVERCGRFRDSESLRHHRVINDQGTVKLSQDTYNSLRLSGILWQADPFKSTRVEEFFATDLYDRYAARITEVATEWDNQVVPVLNELNADQKLRDQVYAFLALSV